jgi:phosphatidylserine/phosphatidylglycerophosphate/cardiolipin synthase-like enzyme
MSLRSNAACLMFALVVCAQTHAAAPVIERGAASRNSGEYAHVRVAFTPGDNVAGIINQEIRAAKSDVRVQAYLFTSKPIADALIAAAKRGVKVEVVADANEYSDGKSSVLPKLASNGVAVYLNDKYKTSHNKIVLIDAALPRATVITGSYNFTRAAQTQNAENIVLLSGNSALAQQFLTNFETHRTQSSRLQ